MNDELARKRPANVASAALPRQEIMTATLHGKIELLAEIHRMAKRGEIGHTYAIQQYPGGWAVKVVRIAERPAWWSRNGLRVSLWAGGILAFLGGLVVLVRALWAALTAVLPLLLGAAIIVAGVVFLVALLRPSGITVSQKVTIR